MKRLLTLILVLISVASFAWPNAKQIEVRPGSMLGWDNASATWRPLAVGPDTGALVTDAEVTIGSITMETTIVPVTEWETQTVTLVANTAQDLVTNITGSRRFVYFKSHEADKEYWLTYNASATLSAGTLVVDNGYFEVPDGVSVSIIASEAFDISVTEGGY